MSDMKTTQNDGDIQAFLANVEHERRRSETQTVMDMMARVTGFPPKMWGDSIIGFDRYEYSRADKSKHAYLITGLSPRKAALTVYIMNGFKDYADQLARLGKHKHSSSCLYITNLANIDLGVLEEIVVKSVDTMRERYH